MISPFQSQLISHGLCTAELFTAVYRRRGGSCAALTKWMTSMSCKISLSRQLLSPSLLKTSCVHQSTRYRGGDKSDISVWRRFAPKSPFAALSIANVCPISCGDTDCADRDVAVAKLVSAPARNVREAGRLGIGEVWCAVHVVDEDATAGQTTAPLLRTDGALGCALSFVPQKAAASKSQKSQQLFAARAKAAIAKAKLSNGPVRRMQRRPAFPKCQ